MRQRISLGHYVSTTYKWFGCSMFPGNCKNYNTEQFERCLVVIFRDMFSIKLILNQIKSQSVSGRLDVPLKSSSLSSHPSFPQLPVIYLLFSLLNSQAWLHPKYVVSMGIQFELILETMNQQLQSSFGSLIVIYFRSYCSLLRNSAKQHMKRETAMSSKWIHIEAQDGGEPKNTA